MEITAIVIALIVGIIVGYVLKTAISQRASSGDCTSELGKTKSEYREYQAQVSRHLKQTADMINSIQSQYGEVQAQIFSAAQDLNRDDGKQNALQPNSHFVSYGEEEPKAETSEPKKDEPPRDYAG